MKKHPVFEKGPAPKCGPIACVCGQRPCISVPEIGGRNLYRFTFRVSPRRTRTCDQWHTSQTAAESAAQEVARQWGDTAPLEIVSVTLSPEISSC